MPIPIGQAQAEILKNESNPSAARMERLRAWAADVAQPSLQAHALTQLTWAEDSNRFSFAAKALESSYAHVRTVAARVLATAPPSNATRKALLEVLPAAADEERAAILWALVVQGEQTIASKALDELGRGGFAKITELDGRYAYDELILANMFSAEELVGFPKDAPLLVRKLVAIRFARRPESRGTPVLLELLKDSDDDVSAIAAGGLARSADKRAQEVLLEGLRSVSREKRQKWIEGIRDFAGGPGLVFTLASIPAKPEESAWLQTKQVFDLLGNLADPRVGDALVAWAGAGKRHAHWLGVVGLRLAEVGDIRAAKFLGDRLRLEPEKVYTQKKFWEADEGGHLSRTDLPRVTGARMLADLAMIHPDKHAELLAAAEEGMLYWVRSRPQPHANGLRFLTAAGSTKILPELRDWAFPKDPLPKPGDSPPFPSVFETAQVALRYIGLRKDEPSFPKLLEQLGRKKDKTLNITQENLMEAGLAMLGMSLRALGYGAANGLAHWGDARAAAPLMTFIEDETWHEEARQAACEALAWCADGPTTGEVARKAQAFGTSNEAAKKFIGACYAVTLSQKPNPEFVPQFVEALGPSANADLQLSYARAIGLAGFDAAAEEKLFRKLEDPASRQAAALALMLGGNADVAMRVVATMAAFGPAVIEQLKDHYFRAFGYWSDLDFARGNVYRWVDNAEAIAHVEAEGVRQTWAVQRLQSQFENLRFDNGPHSETRVVVRERLRREAKTGNAQQKKNAIRTLTLMREYGVLLALQDEPGDLGPLVRRALHVLRNPLPGKVN